MRDNALITMRHYAWIELQRGLIDLEQGAHGAALVRALLKLERRAEAGALVEAVAATPWRSRELDTLQRALTPAS
jgi:hypothetical protein